MKMSVGGVMVSIDAFQALDPGSIPGHRSPFILIRRINGNRTIGNAQLVTLCNLHSV